MAASTPPLTTFARDTPLGMDGGEELGRVLTGSSVVNVVVNSRALVTVVDAVGTGVPRENTVDMCRIREEVICVRIVV